MNADRIPFLARDERLARRAGFWWGFAEGLCFFIVPDVYVTFATLFSLRAGAMAWIASIAGSLAGVAAIYLLQVLISVDYLRFLPAIPGISGALVERVRMTLAAGGLPYTLLLVLGGVPLKVYAGAAFSLGMPIGLALVWTVFARIVRMAPAFVLAALARLAFRQAIDGRPAAWSVLLAAVWVIFYVYYFVQMGW